MGEKKRGFFGSFRNSLSANGVEDEVNDGVGKKDDDEAKNGVEDGVFGVGDFFAIAAGDDIADATPN